MPESTRLGILFDDEISFKKTQVWQQSLQNNIKYINFKKESEICANDGDNKLKKN